MRRWIDAVVMVALSGALVLLIPTVARADGGSYIDFSRTYYLPGETAVGTTYVSVPERAEGLLDRGPFYAFLLPRGVTIREDRPIPERALRLGTFEVDEERSWYDFVVLAVIPQLPSGFYDVAVCNDPCTISGFREPIIGSLGVVHTLREAQLLKTNDRLHSRVYGLTRRLHRTQHDVADLEREARADATERAGLAAQAMALRTGIDASRLDAGDTGGRPLIGGWSAAAISTALVVGALVVARARRQRSSEPHALAIDPTELWLEASPPATGSVEARR